MIVPSTAIATTVRRLLLRCATLNIAVGRYGAGPLASDGRDIGSALRGCLGGSGRCTGGIVPLWLLNACPI